MDISQPSVVSASEAGVRGFMHRVFSWMAAGLAVTGACSLYMAAHPQMILNMVRNPVMFWGLMIAELGLVFFLSGWVSKMEAATAKFAFLFYAALTGISLSVVFLAYTGASIANTFFVTAGAFGLLAAYGWLTKTDLTSIGNLAGMALMGIILASVVNFWLRSPGLDWAVTYIGILVFTALTAYDTQKIKQIYRDGAGDEEETKEAILGALALYLDFINLFLDLLRLFGSRRD
jgi:FtsH-binding integral membrane protein